MGARCGKAAEGGRMWAGGVMRGVGWCEVRVNVWERTQRRGCHGCQRGHGRERERAGERERKNAGAGLAGSGRENGTKRQGTHQSQTSSHGAARLCPAPAAASRRLLFCGGKSGLWEEQRPRLQGGWAGKPERGPTWRRTPHTGARGERGSQESGAALKRAVCCEEIDLRERVAQGM